MANDLTWCEYKRTKDIELRNKIIEEYIKIVQVIASRMYNQLGGKVEYEELVSNGVLGLIDSIDKYDIHSGNKFETYATIRIRGSMLDQIRKQDILPRDVRKKSKDIQKAISFLENSLGRTPKNSEIAEYLKITEQEVCKNLADTAIFNVTSLEEILEVQKIEIRQKENTPEEEYLIQDLKTILVEAINSLKEKEKLVITLYYYEELMYKEIGEIIGVSESRVSQIHSKAILKLKNYLESKGVS